MIIILILLGRSCQTTPAGHVKIVKTFGKVSDKKLYEGLNFILPWQSTATMSIQTQEVFQQSVVPSKEGLEVAVDASILYRLDANKANKVYQKLGKNYLRKVIVPNFKSSLRNACALFEAKALYTEGRNQIKDLIYQDINALLADRGIILENVLLRSVDLPQQVSDAIEAKLKAEQESQAMQFVLDKERQEADRKRIEARGIQDFQRIVVQGIDDRLLRWKGIEATNKIAESKNAKVVVIGAGKNGLPIILNQ